MGLLLHIHGVEGMQRNLGDRINIVDASKGTFFLRSDNLPVLRSEPLNFIALPITIYSWFRIDDKYIASIGCYK